MTQGLKLLLLVQIFDNIFKYISLEDIDPLKNHKCGTSLRNIKKGNWYFLNEFLKSSVIPNRNMQFRLCS